eukprot:jgi/Mesvir1/4496/Mv03775-RA.1
MSSYGDSELPRWGNYDAGKTKRRRRPFTRVLCTCSGIMSVLLIVASYALVSLYQDSSRLKRLAAQQAEGEEALRSVLGDLREGLKEKERALEIKENIVSELRKELAEKQSAMAKKEMRLFELEEDTRAADRDTKSLKEEAEATRRALAARDEELAKSKVQLAEKEEQLNVLLRRVTDASASASVQLEAGKREQLAALEAKDVQIRALEEQLATYQAELVAREKELEAAQRKAAAPGGSSSLAREGGGAHAVPHAGTDGDARESKHDAGTAHSGAGAVGPGHDGGPAVHRAGANHDASTKHHVGANHSGGAAHQGGASHPGEASKRGGREGGAHDAGEAKGVEERVEDREERERGEREEKGGHAQGEEALEHPGVRQGERLGGVGAAEEQAAGAEHEQAERGMEGAEATAQVEEQQEIGAGEDGGGDDGGAVVDEEGDAASTMQAMEKVEMELS